MTKDEMITFLSEKRQKHLLRSVPYSKDDGSYKESRKYLEIINYIRDCVDHRRQDKFLVVRGVSRKSICGELKILDEHYEYVEADEFHFDHDYVVFTLENKVVKALKKSEAISIEVVASE